VYVPERFIFGVSSERFCNLGQKSAKLPIAELVVSLRMKLEGPIPKLWF